MFTSVLIFAGGMACARWSGLVQIYPELTMALLGALSIFSGANVFGRWMTASHTTKLAGLLKNMSEDDDPKDKPEKPEEK